MTERHGGMRTVTCPCGDEHDIPAALEVAITDFDAVITADLGDLGTWRIPKVFIYYHGAVISGIPELAERYGFECVAEPAFRGSAE